eukprot:COSAG01_NODE_19176_length_1026_cov_0.752967_2_plen_53_part_01
MIPSSPSAPVPSVSSSEQRVCWRRREEGGLKEGLAGTQLAGTYVCIGAPLPIV